MTSENKFKLAAALYAAVAIATFGNAAVFFEGRGIAERLRCEMTAEKGKEWVCSGYEATGVGALVSSVAWPLYWSYRIAQ